MNIYQQSKQKWQSKMENEKEGFGVDGELCDECGSTENVSFAADPYASELRGDDTPRWVCAGCRESSAWEI